MSRIRDRSIRGGRMLVGKRGPRATLGAKERQSEYCLA